MVDTTIVIIIAAVAIVGMVGATILSFQIAKKIDNDDD